MAIKGHLNKCEFTMGRAEGGDKGGAAAVSFKRHNLEHAPTHTHTEVLFQLSIGFIIILSVFVGGLFDY